MQTLKIINISFAVLYFICFLYLLIKTKKPVKYLFFNALLGLWLLAVINLIAFITGVHIPLNVHSLSVVSIGSVFACVLLLILKYVVFGYCGVL